MPEGECVYISQVPSKLCYNIYISLCKGLTHEKDEGSPGSRVGQYFNILPISGNRGHAIMKSQAFSRVNNIACAIYRKISIHIAVGYCRIECTASTMMLKPIYSMAFIIFTLDIGFIYYSKMFNAI